MDQTKANFYGNQILEAIETVATSVTSKLNFDKTILCTITNDKNKKNGEYEVSDGSSTFKVYSEDDSYTKDMAVYVLIPQGNYDNQKTIVGKYVDDVGSSIKYIPASESIIEIVRFDKTEAPVSNKIQDKEWSLLANGSKTEVDVYHATWANNTNIYTCASLKANFRTDLSQYNMVSGDYGLLLTLDGYKSQDDGTLRKIDKAITYKFSSAEMYGNPYNYNIYFNHDIVFDLTEHLKDVKITDVKIKYYQDGNFTDLTQGKINSSVTEGIKTIFLEDNLFVKDIELAFGYTTEDITSEGVRIYTTSNSKFAKRDDTKKILLKWFTKNSIGSKAAYGIIDEMDEAEDSGRDFSVYWYRYKIGNQDPDPILGKDGFWEIIPGGIYNDKKYVHQQQPKMAMNYETQTNEVVYKIGPDGKPVQEIGPDGNLTNVIVMEDTERLEYTLIQDNNGRYTKDGGDKLILALPTTAAADRYKIEIKTEPVYDSSLAKPTLVNPFIYNFGPNELLDYEKIKVVLQQHQYEEVQTPDEDNPDIVYIHFIDAYDRYISNELVFENENPADKNLAGVDFIRNLRLECGDLSDGVYMIYNETTGAISDTSKRDNVLYAKFDNYTTKDIPKADEKCKITWKIPANSMIEPVNFKMPYEAETIDGKTYYQINTTVADAESRAPIEWVLNGGYYELSYYWTVKGEETTDAEGNKIYETTDAVEESSLLMHYALKSNYIRHTNDVVICEIEKYGKKYTEEIKMSFGSAGVSGTKYSLVVSLGKKYGDGADPSSLPSSLFNVDYLNASEPNTWIKVTAKLYNEKFKDITDGRDFDWKLYNDNGSLEIKDGDKKNECYIRLGRNAKSSPALGVNDKFELSEYYGILQVSVQAEWASLEDEVTLTTYLPIGVKKDDSIKQYTGAEKLIYNTQGNAPENDGFQSSHTLSPDNAKYWKLKLIGYDDENHSIYHYAPTFKKNVTEEKEIEIEIEEGKKEKKIVYTNELIDSSTLTPTNLYYNEMKNEKMTIFAFDNSDNILFAQPLYYGQDVYNVSLLNNWSGNQIIDPDGNKILTALVGAGIKEDDNTFSGVFMGTICDVSSTKDNDKKTGLLGFQAGQHTFGFHTDGTAFIGPPGQGRIEFDGTQGIISSYDENTVFNLKDGSIYLSNSNNDAAAAQILIDSTGKEAYFQIKAKSIDPTDDTKVGTTIDKELIKIAASEYYLQSRQYTDGEVTYTEEETLEGGKTQTITTIKDGAGVKFDLQNGSLHGYDFELIAGGNVTTQIAGETTSSTVNKQIKISSKDAYIPFSIGGDQFTIKWDGTMEAKNGYFTGEITANTGTIGNWTIVKNALFKNDDSSGVVYTDLNKDTLSSFAADDGTALMAPGAGISVSDLEIFITKKFTPTDGGYKDGYSDYFDLPVVDLTTGEITKPAAAKETDKILIDNEKIDLSSRTDIVFAIGTKFAVTSDGHLYANGATLTGYTEQDIIPELSEELINIATGKVGKEAVDREAMDAAEAATREAADIAEQAARESADIAEETARKEADSAEEAARKEADAKEEAHRVAGDNGLRGYIGGINFNLEGALSQVGYYGDQSVFMDSTLGISDSTKYKLIGGYANVIYKNASDKEIQDPTTLKYIEQVDKFYGVKYTYSDADKVAPEMNVIYQDIDNPNNYYSKVYTKDTNSDGVNDSTPVFAEVDTSKLASDVKRSAAKVYITAGATAGELFLYKSRTCVEDKSKVLTAESNTFYVDLDSGQCYKWDGTEYKLIGPEDKVVMFMVKTDGLLQAANAVIHGTVYAHAGYIGGWTIQHGGLTYGNIDRTNNGTAADKAWILWPRDVNLTPDGLYVKNGKLFGYDLSDENKKKAYKRLPGIDSTSGDGEIIYSEIYEDAIADSDSKQGYYGDWASISKAKKCILNIGWNFAVDEDGKLYAQGADLGGYTKAEDFDALGTLVNTLQGNLGTLDGKITSNTTGITNINNQIQSWSNQYGKIVKYKEKSNRAYFLTNLPTDCIGFKTIGSIPEATTEKIMYYNTDDGKFYYKSSAGATPSEYKSLKTFDVSSTGLFYANNAVLSGTVYATTGWFTGGVTASEGSIGPWKIDSTKLYGEVKNLSNATAYDISFNLPTYEFLSENFTITNIEIMNLYSTTDIKSKFNDATYFKFYSNDLDDYRIQYTVQTTSITYNTSITYDDTLFVDSIDIIVDGIDKTEEFMTSRWSAKVEKRIGNQVRLIINPCPTLTSAPAYLSPISVPFSTVSSMTLVVTIKGSKQYTCTITPTTLSTKQVTYSGKDISIDEFLISAGKSGSSFYKDLLLSAAANLTNSPVVKLQDNVNKKIFSIGLNGNLVWQDTINAASMDGITMFPHDKDNFIISVLNTSNNPKGLWGFRGSDGAFMFNRFETQQFENSIGVYRGGFQLNGPDFSTEFWNNALYTYNTISPSTSTYTHYIGFLRGVGDTSDKMTNVFLGCKQIKNSSDSTFPKHETWSSSQDSEYVFYIRFDGKARFESFHTKQWIDGTLTKFTIRPNENKVDRKALNQKYYLGTTNFPWDGIFVTKNDVVYDVGTIFDPATATTFQNVGLNSPNARVAALEYQVTNDGTTKTNLVTFSTEEGWTLHAKNFLISNSVTADTLNQKGVKTAALKMKYGGAGYYSLLSCKNGLWYEKSRKDDGTKDNFQLAETSTNMFWNIGVDGSSYKEVGDTPAYRMMFSVCGDNISAETYAPRISFQMIYQPYWYTGPEDKKYYDGENKAYFVVKQRDSTNADTDLKNKVFKQAEEGYLGHPKFKWTGIYVDTTASISVAAETYSNISDARLKDIQSKSLLHKIMTVYNNLNPVVYKYKNLQQNEQHQRTHVGLIAQEVERSVYSAGLTNEDFAIVQKQKLEIETPGCPDGIRYYLNYNELHGLHVLKNQEQDKRILELERKVQQLEQEILNLRGKGV